MKQSLKKIQLLIARLSISLLACLIGKILFFLFNHSYFTDVSILKFIAILFYGIRFDLSALVLINSPFILLHIIPFNFTKSKWYQFILKTVFIIVNTIAILADCMDLEYYKFTRKRTTADFFDMFGLGSDITGLIPQYIKDFWYIALIWLALIVLIAYLYNKTTSKQYILKFASSSSARLSRMASWLLLNALLIGLIIIAFRGGLQLRPIMPINAAEYVPAKNIPLIISTPFSIIKSYGLEQLEEKNYFTEDSLVKIFNPIHHVNKQTDTTGIQSPVQRPNIFIIILESFSKEYIGSLSNRPMLLEKKKTFTPFLDSLIKGSLVFDNAFANGKKSIEGIPAILAGIPSLMNESYITSTYCSNRFTALPNMLKHLGYSSAFFHGGTDGTMGFDAFCNAAGFDKYYGRYEYNNEKDYDGNWGIWDEKFFQYTEQTVTKMKEPFMTAIFSLSSHHPYSIPDKYKNRFKDGSIPILKTVEYTDYALKEFFALASKEKWFDNTLFVITADHTGPLINGKYANDADLFRVPILFYQHNNIFFKGIKHRITQHIDIMPTILNYLKNDVDYYSMGSDMLDTTQKGYAVNDLYGVFQLIKNDDVLQFAGNKEIAFYNLKTDTLFTNNRIGTNPKKEKGMEDSLKAIIQTYYNDMIHNRMTASSRAQKK